jgi:Flp pilus assembly protein TadD
LEMIGKPYMLQQIKRRATFLCCLLLAILAVPTGRQTSGPLPITKGFMVPPPGGCPALDANIASAPRAQVALPIDRLRDEAGVQVGAAAPPCSSANDCVDQAEQLFRRLSGGLAKAPLERALALDPSNVRAYTDLALVYMRRHDGICAGLSPDMCSREDYVQAEAACRAALDLSPDDTQALLLLGKVINREVERGFRMDVAAIQPLKRAIEINPNCPDLYSELGHAYRLANRYDEAVAAYNTDAALRLEMGPAEAHGEGYSAQRQQLITDALTISWLCEKTGDHKRAVEALEHAEILDPDDDVVHFRLGKAYLAAGDVVGAKKELALVTAACRSKDEMLVYRCEAAASELREAVERTH